MKCQYCEAVITEGAKFCPECGKQLSLADNLDDGIFARKLSEDEMRSGVMSSEMQVPYGFIGVIVADGVVKHVESSQRSLKVEGFADRIGNFLRNLGGSKSGTEAYLFSDISTFPFVTWTKSFDEPGKKDALANFQFWIDPDNTEGNYRNLGFFIQKFLQGKASLSIRQFESICSSAVSALWPAWKPEISSDGLADFSGLINALKESTGIECRAQYSPGHLVVRRFLDITASDMTRCDAPGCGTMLSLEDQFCPECGKKKTADTRKFLLLKSGEQVTLQVSYSIYSNDDNADLIDSDLKDEFDTQIRDLSINILATAISSTSMDQIESAGTLDELTRLLEKNLPSSLRSFYGDSLEVGGYAVTDIKLSQKAWMLGTEARLQEALRNIEAEKKYVSLGSSRADLQELIFANTLRETKQRNAHAFQLRIADIESRENASDLEDREAKLEIDGHRRNTNTEIGKDLIDATAANVRANIAREQNAQKKFDEVTELDHQLEMENKVADNDLGRATKTAAAESQIRRTQTADDIYAKEEEQRLQVEKLRALAELDMKLKQQEDAQELAKFEALKGLSSEAALIAQAPNLSADVAKSIADAQTARYASSVKSDIEKNMYERMLQEKKASDDRQMEMYRMAMGAIKETGERVDKVHKESVEAHKAAAEIAQSVNEKSMDAMAKVAGVKAKVSVQKTVSAEETGKEETKACPACEEEVDGSSKFCTNCGYEFKEEDEE